MTGLGMTGLGMIGTSARLLRGFATDFLTAHDVRVVEAIMDPAYRLSIGGHVFDGRDTAYLPATAAQLDQFPGLVVTVHDVILGTDAVAMRFTEHGVSLKQPGRAAAWGGVTLFRIEGGRLHRGWAEEDYFARKRQLKNGVCDAILPPHPAPWDAPCEAPDPETERIARAWLEKPDAPLCASGFEEIRAEGTRFGALIEPTGVTINQLFTAGNRAAFHLDCAGRYAGGFDDIDATRIRTPVVLRMAGLIDVSDGKVTRAQVSADRLGLHRALLDAGKQS
jgi:SnoaL-like polyketide cyclase